MIFADRRYKRKDFFEKIPHWIKHQVSEGNKDMSTDIAVQTAAWFFKEMGQPFSMPSELMFTEEKLAKM